AARHLMGHTLLVAGRMDSNDPTDVATALEQVRELLDFCSGHVHHENDFVHVAMERVQPDSSGRIAGEHIEHLRHIAELRQAVAAVERAPEGQRRARARQLYARLALFVAHNFEHMDYEERVHNALLQSHYRDEEIAAVERELVASIPPEEMSVILRWMLPAMNHD